MAKAYHGDKGPWMPLVSPIHADLKVLPLPLIHMGIAETLLNDSIRLAAYGKSAGVKIIPEPWENMIHVCHSIIHVLPDAQQAIKGIGEFV
jgi:monoterpene epsilon-lactone hydrolase